MVSGSCKIGRYTPKGQVAHGKSDVHARPIVGCRRIRFGHTCKFDQRIGCLLCEFLVGVWEQTLCKQAYLLAAPPP